MLAFVNEHNFFDGDRIVVASSGVLDAVDLILESIDVGIIKIPSWDELMREGELKGHFGQAYSMTSSVTLENTNKFCFREISLGDLDGIVQIERAVNPFPLG